MRPPIRRPGTRRRGVTLVEMLVVVALVVLMMTILVQIFQSATGAMSLSRTTQELDVTLRQIDSMIRADLAGVTAKMTPPNDPTQKTGYFEYAENAPADLQGEDTDDYLAFTTKAPEGQVFSGRQYLIHRDPISKNAVDQSIQPVTITSQVGEVLYFLRNGNLYRRVLLVAPDRAKSIADSYTSTAYYSNSAFGPTSTGLTPYVSWQGVNDISCRPGNNGTGVTPPPLPNDLGHLTNRENRIFRPRFGNDFNLPDSVPDDNNADGIPDYYPTLYTDGTNGWAGRPNGSINEVLPFPAAPAPGARQSPGSHDYYAFPFIYPGMYSMPDGATLSGKKVTPTASKLGWRHGMFPGTDAVSKLTLLNHSPLDLGDSLPPPASNQTWWGFPTWRETMIPFSAVGGWGDPVKSIYNTSTQPLGLSPLAPDQPYNNDSTTLLPPMGGNASSVTPLFTDGAGSSSFLPVAASNAPARLWEEDLILTNVRSFDVKAYDPDASLYNSATNGLFSAGYHDLGYGAPDYLAGMTGGTNGVQTSVLFQTVNDNGVSNAPRGFGHEGRIPPIAADYRYHPRYQGSNIVGGVIKLTYGNIGDDHTGVIRLNRVWDSWSTDYTNAPDSDLFLNGYIPGLSNSPPIYPSFPPPYPSPLRGIQIQIRIVDPRNERSKVLTIRHDFTDKL